MTTVDAERAFAYLLGELPDGDASSLDEALLAEPETHEVLQAFEAELFDAYLDRSLPNERRARFEQRFLSTAAGRERLQRARALRQVAARTVASSQSAWWERLAALLTMPRLAVGALVAAALAFVVARPSAAPEVNVSLRPDTVRAADVARRLEVSAASPVVFELALDDAPAASEWKVAVTGPGGFSWSGAPARSDAVAVVVKVSGVSWVSGRYSVSLQSAADVLTYEVDVTVR
ncbi:MAG: hypothetical protein MUC96_11450 [Myxococcaceae bacterium]|jgi:hypothetical protein|nr:hypothetical protein [Myxococcaceae bacterium]